MNIKIKLMAHFTIKSCLLAYFVSLFVIVNGVREGKQIEIHQQIKKTIKTREGIIYDCFDIYKQPAFNNPLLKNHTIQMKPSHPPKDVTSSQLPANAKVSKVGLGEGCPSGTIPIMRTNKEYVQRANLFLKNLQARLIPTAVINPPGFHSAGKVVGSKPDAQYYGASSFINTCNPNVTKNQFSAAITLLQSGPPDKPDHILFGWMVNPTLFGDTSTRTFGAWIAGTQGCFDTACSGFVQVNPSVPINMILTQVSVVGGAQYENKFTVTKDPKTGNWMLYYGSNNVGYWPNTLFSSLSNSASEVIWGGQSFTNDGVSPPMGSGFFVELGSNKAAYIREIQVANKDIVMANPDITLLNYFSDSPKCYNYGPMTGPFTFFFGGPGGNNC